MQIAIPWQDVESSDVRRVGYIDKQEILVVDFIKTGVYTYFQVKAEVFNTFMRAPSKGAFVNKVFKQSNWPYQKGVPDGAILTGGIE